MEAEHLILAKETRQAVKVKNVTAELLERQIELLEELKAFLKKQSKQIEEQNKLLKENLEELKQLSHLNTQELVYLARLVARREAKEIQYKEWKGKILDRLKIKKFIDSKEVQGIIGRSRVTALGIMRRIAEEEESIRFIEGDRVDPSRLIRK